MDNKICYYLDEIEQLENGGWVPPITCEIDPSNRCQNKCSFCIFSKHLKNNNDFLSSDVYFDLITKLRDIGTKSVTFTGGGEPLTHPNIVDMILLAVNRGLEVGLITNGISLHKIEHVIPKLKFIRVSLNAATAKTYYKITGSNFFNKVVTNINSIVGKTCVGLSFVICNENQNETEAMKQLGKKLKVDYVQLKPNVNGGTVKGLDTIEDNITVITNRYTALDKLPCTIAGLIGIVGADGEVWYCCQKRGQQKYSLGNLHNNDFETLWRDRNNIQPDIKTCKVCRYSNYAIGYKKYKSNKYSYLKHRNFL